MDNPALLAQLRIQFPDGAVQVVPITTTTFDIGRVASNNLVLPDAKISRHHVRLLFEGDRVSLIDMNSRNRTFFGGVPLPPNVPQLIAFGASFVIGPYTLTLEAPPRPAEPEPPAEAGPEAAEAPPAAEPAAPAAAEAEPKSEPPQEPPPSLPPQFVPGDPERYNTAFGLPPYASRYLQHLPPIYHEHPFLGQFLLAFEGVLTPVEQMVDNFDLYLDAYQAPAYFLEQLGEWLGLALDEKWPVAKRRALVAEAAELYRRRGTRWALSRYLQIYADAKPEIREPEDRPHHFEVVLRLPPGGSVDRPTVERIIDANRPVHTTYSLEIVRG